MRKYSKFLQKGFISGYTILSGATIQVANLVNYNRGILSYQGLQLSKGRCDETFAGEGVIEDERGRNEES